MCNINCIFSDKFETNQGPSEDQSDRTKTPDAIGLAFPDQPKTKVIIAEELKEEEEEDRKSQRLSDSQRQALYKYEMGSNTFINCDLRFFNLQYLVD
jgi:hypothetical protein